MLHSIFMCIEGVAEITMLDKHAVTTGISGCKFLDSCSFLFPLPCRSGEPLPVNWSTLCVVTVDRSGVYSTGATTSSVGVPIIPSGLLLVN